MFTFWIAYEFVGCFTSRTRMFRSYGDDTISGEGLQKRRPKLGTYMYVPWAGRDLYRATSAVARDLGFCSL